MSRVSVQARPVRHQHEDFPGNPWLYRHSASPSLYKWSYSEAAWDCQGDGEAVDREVERRGREMRGGEIRSATGTAEDDHRKRR